MLYCDYTYEYSIVHHVDIRIVTSNTDYTCCTCINPVMIKLRVLNDTVDTELQYIQNKKYKQNVQIESIIHNLQIQYNDILYNTTDINTQIIQLNQLIQQWNRNNDLYDLNHQSNNNKCSEVFNQQPTALLNLQYTIRCTLAELYTATHDYINSFHIYRSVILLNIQLYHRYNAEQINNEQQARLHNEVYIRAPHDIDNTVYHKYTVICMKCNYYTIARRICEYGMKLELFQLNNDCLRGYIDCMLDILYVIGDLAELNTLIDNTLQYDKSHHKSLLYRQLLSNSVSLTTKQQPMYNQIQKLKNNYCQSVIDEYNSNQLPDVQHVISKPWIISNESSITVQSFAIYLNSLIDEPYGTTNESIETADNATSMPSDHFLIHKQLTDDTNHQLNMAGNINTEKLYSDRLHSLTSVIKIDIQHSVPVISPTGSPRVEQSHNDSIPPSSNIITDNTTTIISNATDTDLTFNNTVSQSTQLPVQHNQTPSVPSLSVPSKPNILHSKRQSLYDFISVSADHNDIDKQTLRFDSILNDPIVTESNNNNTPIVDSYEYVNQFINDVCDGIHNNGLYDVVNRFITFVFDRQLNVQHGITRDIMLPLIEFVYRTTPQYSYNTMELNELNYLLWIVELILDTTQPQSQRQHTLMTQLLNDIDYAILKLKWSSTGINDELQSYIIRRQCTAAQVAELSHNYTLAAELYKLLTTIDNLTILLPHCSIINVISSSAAQVRLNDLQTGLLLVDAQAIIDRSQYVTAKNILQPLYNTVPRNKCSRGQYDKLVELLKLSSIGAHDHALTFDCVCIQFNHYVGVLAQSKATTALQANKQLRDNLTQSLDYIIEHAKRLLSNDTIECIPPEHHQLNRLLSDVAQCLSIVSRTSAMNHLMGTCISAYTLVSCVTIHSPTLCGCHTFHIELQLCDTAHKILQQYALCHTRSGKRVLRLLLDRLYYKARIRPSCSTSDQHVSNHQLSELYQQSVTQIGSITSCLYYVLTDIYEPHHNYKPDEEFYEKMSNASSQRIYTLLQSIIQQYNNKQQRLTDNTLDQILQALDCIAWSLGLSTSKLIDTDINNNNVLQTNNDNIDFYQFPQFVHSYLHCANPSSHTSVSLVPLASKTKPHQWLVQFYSTYCQLLCESIERDMCELNGGVLYTFTTHELNKIVPFIEYLQWCVRQLLSCTPRSAAGWYGAGLLYWQQYMHTVYSEYNTFYLHDRSSLSKLQITQLNDLYTCWYYSIQCFQFALHCIGGDTASHITTFIPIDSMERVKLQIHERLAQLYNTASYMCNTSNDAVVLRSGMTLQLIQSDVISNAVLHLDILIHQCTHNWWLPYINATLIELCHEQWQVIYQLYQQAYSIASHDRIKYMIRAQQLKLLVHHIDTLDGKQLLCSLSDQCSVSMEGDSTGHIVMLMNWMNECYQHNKLCYDILKQMCQLYLMNTVLLSSYKDVLYNEFDKYIYYDRKKSIRSYPSSILSTATTDETIDTLIYGPQHILWMYNNPYRNCQSYLQLMDVYCQLCNHTLNHEKLFSLYSTIIVPSTELCGILDIQRLSIYGHAILQFISRQVAQLPQSLVFSANEFDSYLPKIIILSIRCADENIPLYNIGVLCYDIYCELNSDDPTINEWDDWYDWLKNQRFSRRLNINRLLCQSVDTITDNDMIESSSRINQPNSNPVSNNNNVNATSPSTEPITSINSFTANDELIDIMEDSIDQGFR